MIKKDDLFPIYAYILSGWKSLKNFIGPAFVQVASEMGEKIYEYLKDAEVISDEACRNVNDAINVVLNACERCKIPVNKISVEKISENAVKFIFYEKALEIPYIDVLKKDDAWTYLPLPMLAMLFALLKNISGTELRPSRFSADYKENRWIYMFTFFGTIKGLLK